MQPQQIVINEPNEKKKSIRSFSILEPIVGIIFAVACTTIFGFFSEIITWSYYGTTHSNIQQGVIRLVPTFDKDVISSIVVLVILWGLLRVAINVFYLVERSYTRRLSIVSIVGNALTFIVSLIILIPPRIVNEEYVHHVHTAFQGNMTWFGNVIANPNLVILVLMLILLFFESFNIVRKGWKNH